MPQFDKITFFNQIFWLMVLFLCFYLIFLQKLLPQISVVLKARFKKLIRSTRFAKELILEKQNISRASAQITQKVADSSRIALLSKLFVLNHPQKSLPTLKKLLFIYAGRLLETSIKTI